MLLGRNKPSRASTAAVPSPKACKGRDASTSRLPSRQKELSIDIFSGVTVSDEDWNELRRLFVVGPLSNLLDSTSPKTTENVGLLECIEKVVGLKVPCCLISSP